MVFPESSTENLAWGFFALYTFIFVLANGLFFYTQFFKKDGRNKVILISKIFYAFMAAFSLVRMIDLLLLINLKSDVGCVSTTFVLSRLALCCLLTGFSVVVYRGAKTVFALNKKAIRICFWLLLILNVLCWLGQLISCIIFFSIFDYGKSAESSTDSSAHAGH